jgi:hypothetical protein
MDNSEIVKTWNFCHKMIKSADKSMSDIEKTMKISKQELKANDIKFVISYLDGILKMLKKINY